MKLLLPRKLAAKAVRGLSIKLDRVADLHDLAAVHDHDPVGHGQGFFLVVRHVDEGGADPVVNVLQLLLHIDAQLAVERAQRLVEQQHPRREAQRARQCHALLLAARKLVRIAVGKALAAARGPASRLTRASISACGSRRISSG